MGLIDRILRRILSEALRRFTPEPQRKVHKRIVDRDFDAAHGVDTGGIAFLSGLDIDSPNRKDGVSHIAVDPQEFHSAMSSVDIDFSRFTFIDLGSGKGRALMLARSYGFKELIGVEFSSELVEIARRNGIETICADATEYELPNEPTVLFLYNPFGRSVMEQVAARTRASLEKYPRELVVLYLNPFEIDRWLSAGFELTFRGSHFAVLKFS